MSRPLRSRANRGVDALVAAAAADVAEHGVVDLLVRGCGGFREQGRGLHDLAALAVPALRHADVAPGDLDRMFAGRMEAFDRGDGLAADVGHRDAAGANGFTVEMNGTGAAERYATAEFRAGQAEFVAQKPQQRHRRIAVERPLLSIYFYADHEFLRWRISGATELPPLSAWRCLKLAASRRSAPHAVSEAGGSM